MKTIYIRDFKEKDNLEIREIEAPVMTSQDVRIRVKASGLNRADLLQRRGLYPPPPGIQAEIPGLECAGEVIEIGNMVRNFAPGDRVMALLSGTGQAQEVVVSQDCVMKIPEGLDYIQAAAIPEVFITAYDALILQGQFSLGQSVLIHAVGSGVGTAALQLALLAGAQKIFGTASLSKLQKAQELGLPHAIDYQNQDFQQQIAPHKVDVILDFIGGDYWQKNIHCLKTGGRLILIGLMGGGKFPENTVMFPLLQKRLHIIGTVLRSRENHEKAQVVAQFSQNILPLFTSGKLKPIVDRIFPVDKVSEAYDYLEQNRNFGKVILAWDQQCV